MSFAELEKSLKELWSGKKEAPSMTLQWGGTSFTQEREEPLLLIHICGDPCCVITETAL